MSGSCSAGNDHGMRKLGKSGKSISGNISCIDGQSISGRVGRSGRRARRSRHIVVWKERGRPGVSVREGECDGVRGRGQTGEKVMHRTDLMVREKLHQEMGKCRRERGVREMAAEERHLED